MPEEREQAPWRNPAWIGAIAALLTAVAGLIGLVISNAGGGGDGGPQVAATGPSSSMHRVATTVESGGVPLTVGVKEVTGEAGDNWTFAPGGAHPGQFTGATGDELRTWVEVHGRAAGEQTLELTVRGTQDDPVVVNGLRAQVVEASRPNAAALLTWVYGCGGVPKREARINLEDPALRFTWFDETGERPQFPTLRVDKTDIEVLEISASTKSSDIAWRLILSYEFQGRTGEVVIDDGGRPFVVTAPHAATTAHRVQGREPARIEVLPAPENNGKLGGFC